MDPPKRPPPFDQAPQEKKKRVKKEKKPEGQPHRPLSAYNCFFRAERVRLLQELELRGEKAVAREAGAASDGEGEATSANSERSEKRKTKFYLLGKIIGKRWRALSKSEKAQYENIAATDMKRYRKEMDDYNQSMIRDSSIGRAAMERGTLAGGLALPRALQRRDQSLPSIGAPPDIAQQGANSSLPGASGVTSFSGSLVGNQVAGGAPLAQQNPFAAQQQGIPQTSILGLSATDGTALQIQQTTAQQAEQLLPLLHLLQSQSQPQQPALGQLFQVAAVPTPTLQLQQTGGFGNPNLAALLPHWSSQAAAAPGGFASAMNMTGIGGGLLPLPPPAAPPLQVSAIPPFLLPVLLQQLQQQQLLPPNIPLQLLGNASTVVGSPPAGMTLQQQLQLQEILRSQQQELADEEAGGESTHFNLLSDGGNLKKPPPS